MRAAVVQFAPEFPGREPNWGRICRYAADTAAEVIVLPELATCGYSYQDPQEIEPFTDGLTALRPLGEIARKFGRLIVGGFAENDQGILYNSAFAVGPESTQIYRKIHLWNRELSIFRPGDRPLVVAFKGRRFGIEICYDLQFPELASLYSRLGAEAILVPMAWPAEGPRPSGVLEPYSHLAVATAYSHGIHVLVANRTGDERGARFLGQSSAADPFGRIRHLGGAEGVLETELDFAQVSEAKRPNGVNDLDRDARLLVSGPLVEGS